MVEAFDSQSNQLTITREFATLIGGKAYRLQGSLTLRFGSSEVSSTAVEVGGDPVRDLSMTQDVVALLFFYKAERDAEQAGWVCTACL